MIYPPPRLTGTNKLAKWLNSLREAVNSCRITSIIGGQLITGSNGTQLIIRPGVSGGSNPIKAYKVVSAVDDYLTVRTWDWTNMGDTDLQIAKPYLLRVSRTSEVVELETGVETTYDFTYDYSTYPGTTENPLRKKTNHDNATDYEWEQVSPLWRQGDIVHAQEADTGVVNGDGDPITLLLVSDTRAWTAIDDV